MAKIVRLNDTSDHNGRMVTATGDFTVDGLQGCVTGDLHECPIVGHGTTAVTSTYSATAYGKAIIRTGDQAGCGAIIEAGGSTTAD